MLRASYCPSEFGGCSIFCRVQKELAFHMFIFTPKLTAGHACFRGLWALRPCSNPGSGKNKPLNQTVE